MAAAEKIRARRRKYIRKWRKKNPEKSKALAHKYYVNSIKNNPERKEEIYARRKEFYKENRLKFLKVRFCKYCKKDLRGTRNSEYCNEHKELAYRELHRIASIKYERKQNKSSTKRYLVSIQKIRKNIP
jgi:hypothetical protein